MEEILIGREEASSQLAVITDRGAFKLRGNALVPLTVSRVRPNESRGHCMLTITDNGRAILSNMNPQNVTYVNGRPITSVEVDEDSMVQLGPELYVMNIKQILQKIGYKKPYAINHLQRVWRNYEQAMLDLQLEQSKLQNKRGLQSIFSMSGMLVVFLPDHLFGEDNGWIIMAIRIIGVVSALSLALYFYFKGRNPKNSFVMKKYEMENKLKGEYICPHCNNFLGMHTYESLRNAGVCPACKCKLQEM